MASWAAAVGHRRWCPDFENVTDSRVALLAPRGDFELAASVILDFSSQLLRSIVLLHGISSSATHRQQLFKLKKKTAAALLMLRKSTSTSTSLLGSCADQLRQALVLTSAADEMLLDLTSIPERTRALFQDGDTKESWISALQTTQLRLVLAQAMDTGSAIYEGSCLAMSLRSSVSFVNTLSQTNSTCSGDVVSAHEIGERLLAKLGIQSTSGVSNLSQICSQFVCQ